MNRIRAIIPLSCRRYPILIREMQRVFERIVRQSGSGSLVDVTDLPEPAPSDFRGAFYPELASPYVVVEAIKAQEEGFDAILIPACEETGVDAARETVDIPVVGCLQASCTVAALLGHRFALLYPHRNLTRVLPNVLKYGFRDRCVLRSAQRYGEPLSWGVPDVSLVMSEEGRKEYPEQFERFAGNLERRVREIVQEVDVGVVVIACGGWTNAAQELRRRLSDLSLQVVDPLEAGFAVAEMLIHLGARHSRRDYEELLIDRAGLAGRLGIGQTLTG